MSAHTPGPWTRQADETFTHLGDSRIVGANRISPAIVFGGLGEESEANARLISAAPDMLAALKAIVALQNDDLDDEQCAAWDAAVAAIEKAEATDDAG